MIECLGNFFYYKVSCSILKYCNKRILKHLCFGFHFQNKIIVFKRSKRIVIILRKTCFYNPILVIDLYEGAILFIVLYTRICVWYLHQSLKLSYVICIHITNNLNACLKCNHLFIDLFIIAYIYNAVLNIFGTLLSSSVLQYSNPNKYCTSK